MHIIVIDDDETYLNSIKSYCDAFKIGLPFLFFQDAFYAMDFISKNPSTIRVVFTDFNMKTFGMNGGIIVQKCFEKSVPVVLCSGYEKTEIKLPIPIPVISKLNIEHLIKMAQSL